MPRYARPLGPDNLTQAMQMLNFGMNWRTGFGGSWWSAGSWKIAGPWPGEFMRIHRCLMADESHQKPWPNQLGLGNLFKKHRRFRKRTPTSAEVWIEKHWQESIWFTNLTIEVPVRSVRAFSLKPTLGRNMVTWALKTWQNMELICLKRLGQHGVLRLGASWVSQQLTDVRHQLPFVEVMKPVNLLNLQMCVRERKQVI